MMAWQLLTAVYFSTFSTTPGATVTDVPARQEILLTVVVAFTTGYLGLPPGMVTVVVAVGTVLVLQLPAFSQAVLTLPVQLMLMGWANCTTSSK